MKLCKFLFRIFAKNMQSIFCIMVLIVFYGMYPEKIHKQMSKNQRMVKILLEKSKNACALAALLVFLPHNFLQSLL